MAKGQTTVVKRSLILLTTYLAVLLFFLSAGCSVTLEEKSTETGAELGAPSLEAKRRAAWLRMQQEHPVAVVINNYNFSGPFDLERGGTRSPRMGDKFFWIYVDVVNTGEEADYPPNPNEFRVIYADQEILPEAEWGGRKGYPDYPLPLDKVFPGTGPEGWIWFEVPEYISVQDLKVTFRGDRLLLPR